MNPQDSSAWELALLRELEKLAADEINHYDVEGDYSPSRRVGSRVVIDGHSYRTVDADTFFRRRDKGDANVP